MLKKILFPGYDRFSPPSPISPHMLQSNDLCLITGYKCRTSSDRLHIRIQIFIIKPSLRMKVMAVLSPVRDPCIDDAASLATAFPNIPAVQGNRSSLMEGREEVALECCEGRKEAATREAKTSWSTYKPLWLSFITIFLFSKAEKLINTGRALSPAA